MKMINHTLVKMVDKSLKDFIPEATSLPTLQNLGSIQLPPVHERNILRVVPWLGSI